MSAVVVKKDAQGSLYVPLAAWRYRHGCDPPAPGMPLTDPLSPILSSGKFSFSTASDSTSGCAIGSFKLLSRMSRDHDRRFGNKGYGTPADPGMACPLTGLPAKRSSALRMNCALYGITMNLDVRPNGSRVFDHHLLSARGGDGKNNG